MLIRRSTLGVLLYVSEPKRLRSSSGHASRRLAALRSVVLAVAGLLMLIVPAAASVEATNATESESSVNGLQPATAGHFTVSTTNLSWDTFGYLDGTEDVDDVVAYSNDSLYVVVAYSASFTSYRFEPSSTWESFSFKYSGHVRSKTLTTNE